MNDLLAAPHTLRPRDLALDCARGAAISLTCYAHFCSLGRTDINWYLNLSIYQFHMPLFCFLSGVCAYQSAKSVWQRVLLVLSEYFTAQLLFAILFGKYISVSDLLLYPQGINWYFLSEAFWILFSFVLRRFSSVRVVAASLVFSLFFGYLNFDQSCFSIGRSVFLFPFFMAGQYIASLPSASRAEKSKPLLIPCLFCLVLFQLGLAVHQDGINRSWFFGSYAYSQQNYNPFIRSFIYCIAFVWIFVLMNAFRMLTVATLFFPCRILCDFLVQAGQNSISIYLLHGLAYMWMIYHNVAFDLIPPVPREFILIGFSCILIFLFGRKPLCRIVQTFLHIPYRIGAMLRSRFSSPPET